DYRATRRRRSGRRGADTLDLDHLCGVHLLVHESSCAEQHEEKHATDDPARGPLRRLRLPPRAIDSQVFEFGRHGYISRSAVRISLLDALRAGNNPPIAPRIMANSTPVSIMAGVI